jgi:hypothetical protein
LAKGTGELGSIPRCPYFLKRRKPCTSRVPDTRAISGQGMAKGPGPDRSMADFFWCMMAAQHGWSIKETASKLLEVSAKAQARAPA